MQSARSGIDAIRIGAVIVLLGAGASLAQGAPGASRAGKSPGRLEASFARFERLLRTRARSAGACGPRRFYLAVSRNGNLRMLTAPPPAGEARCGLLGKRFGQDVHKIRVNVHSLGKVGAPLGQGRVTLHCRPGAGRCVRLTLADDRGVVRTDRISLVVEPAARAVAEVARAARRFLWLVKNDWRYTRPNTQAQRWELRSAGRPLRNWGLVLTIGGVACLASGGVLMGFAYSDGTFETAIAYGIIGAPLLLVGLVATLVGLPVLFSGLSRLEQARKLDRDADEGNTSAAPRPVRPEHRPRTLTGQLQTPGGSAPLSWSLRLQF